MGQTGENCGSRGHEQPGEGGGADWNGSCHDRREAIAIRHHAHETKQPARPEAGYIRMLTASTLSHTVCVQTNPILRTYGAAGLLSTNNCQTGVFQIR